MAKTAGQNDKHTDLLHAVEEGRVEDVIVLMENSADIKKCRKNAFELKSVLHIASEEGHVNMVKYLLSHLNISVDVRCMHNKTPLYFASFEGHLDVVKVLLENKVDIHLTDAFNQTALHIASESGFIEIVKLLLSNGSRVDALDKLTRMPIHYAAQYGYEDVVSELLGHNSPPDNEDIFGQRPLHCASSRSHVNVVKVLLSHGDLDCNAHDKYSDFPIANAVVCESIEIVRLLLTHPSSNARLDTKTKELQTPLHIALLKRNNEIAKEIAKLLISHGADLEVEDKYGQSPIMIIGALNKERDNERIIEHCMESREMTRDSFNEFVVPVEWRVDITKDGQLQYTHTQTGRTQLNFPKGECYEKLQE